MVVIDYSLLPPDDLGIGNLILTFCVFIHVMMKHGLKQHKLQ